ncbi:unnamed protein product, partial [Heterobilharzia americana]
SDRFNFIMYEDVLFNIHMHGSDNQEVTAEKIRTHIQRWFHKSCDRVKMRVKRQKKGKT